MVYKLKILLFDLYCAEFCDFVPHRRWHFNATVSSMFIVQILPSLLEVMRDVSSRDSATSLVCLQFIYWSMLRLDGVTHGQQVRKISACHSTVNMFLK